MITKAARIKKMVDKSEILNKIKSFGKNVRDKAQEFYRKNISCDAFGKICAPSVREKAKTYAVKVYSVLKTFTKEQPKTAVFIYTCIFCALSVRFFDEPLAVSRLDADTNAFFKTLAFFNPSGWWFFILLFLWLTYMAAGGLSLTTEAFEKNLAKAKAVAFIFLTLLASSAVTFVLNILIGRYTPEMLDSMNLYGFSAFRMRVTETSFPSFGTQSIWAVAVAAATFVPKISKVLYALAVLVTLSLVATAECYLSDAVMGAYIGISMLSVSRWIVSENRENTPLISL